MSALARVLIAIMVATALAVVMLRGDHVPARLDPWAPLSLDARPGPFDALKLRRLDALGCRALLERAGLRFALVEDRALTQGCGLSNAVRVSALRATLDTPTVMTCRTAASLALWDRHVLQREGIRHFDRHVTRIEHYGSYACRDVGGGSGGRRSRHATADAIDVAALQLQDGERVVVRTHWQADDAHAEFLRAVHKGACRWFDGVLGPAYNRAHHDHLHFESGGSRVCR